MNKYTLNLLLFISFGPGMLLAGTPVNPTLEQISAAGFNNRQSNELLDMFKRVGQLEQVLQNLEKVKVSTAPILTSEQLSWLRKQRMPVPVIPTKVQSASSNKHGWVFPVTVFGYAILEKIFQSDVVQKNPWYQDAALSVWATKEVSKNRLRPLRNVVSKQINEFSGLAKQKGLDFLKWALFDKEFIAAKKAEAARDVVEFFRTLQSKKA